MRKGIILAGGSGTRLHPLTLGASKQLMPVYDKPLVFYPLSTLMLAGIREILIISTPQDLSRFRVVLGDGTQLGLSLTYAEQPRPEGLAQAFLIGREFVGKDASVLILGDNIFQLVIADSAKAFEQQRDGARIILKDVEDPQRFGVPVFEDGKIVRIEEKPGTPKSKYAVVGVYFYDHTVFDVIKTLKPSERGELEISDVNNYYIQAGKMTYDVMKGWWTDAGTFESLLRANNLVANSRL